jgi:hypothetical protein
MPVFEEIINQIKGFDHMKGNTKEAAENRSIAFTRAYNA